MWEQLTAVHWAALTVELLVEKKEQQLEQMLVDMMAGDLVVLTAALKVDL